MYKYPIWDVDGTLIDSYPSVNHELATTLSELGGVTSNSRIASLSKLSFSNCLSILAHENNLDLEELTEKFWVRYGTVDPRDQPPFPGAFRVCEQVVQSGNMNFIFTHRPRELLDRCLDHYGVSALFTACLTVDDGYPRKPDPYAFLNIIERYELPPKEIIVIGDRAIDIQAGQAAGVATCFFGEQASLNVASDFSVTSFKDLGEVLFPSSEVFDN